MGNIPVHKLETSVFTNCDGLKELSVVGSRLNRVSDDDTKMTDLEVLSLSNINLKGLLPRNLRQLQVLSLRGSRMGVLPKVICQFRSLIKLSLPWNQLSTIPDNITQLEQLQQLYLSFNKLGVLPDVIFQLLSLIKLYVSQNQLTSIPANITQLEQLQELHLGGNRLGGELPKIICQLKSLIKLSMSHNQLTSVPVNILKLEQLQELYLSSNRLEGELPKVICQLRSLIKLNVSSNQLTSIPANITKLEQLQELYLSNNRLEGELPKVICQLRSLIKLHVSHNQLIAIPDNITQLEKLQELELDYNPLKEPPEVVRQRGLPAIRTYFLDVRRGKARHCKLVLLGSSGAGKTSLAKTLVNNKPSCVQEDDRTIVVDKTAWETEADGAIINIAITDFGGNQWYKIVHHLFLDEKALILLVVNLFRYTEQIFNKEAGSWLNVLMSRVPKAEVVLVGTQIDRLENEESIRLKKTQVLQDVSCFIKKVSDQSDRFKDMLTVSASETLHGFEDLKKRVLNFALTNGQVIPSSWSDVYHDLQNSIITRYQPFLTFNAVKDLVKGKSKEDFKWLVNSLSETKERRTETVLSFFHNIGALLWYEHCDELKAFVFHKAKFLVQIMKDVFSERLSAELLTYQGSFKDFFTSVSFEEAKKDLLERGIMSCDFLRCLWSHCHLKKELFDGLTKLFVHLDLCYPMNQGVPQSPLRFPWFLTQEAPETQLVQMMLHARPPRGSHRLSLNYVYPAMCPEPLYHIFVVRLHRHVHDIKSRQDWKDGLYAWIQETQVLVHRSHEATETVISVSSEGSDLLEVWTVLLSCHKELIGVMNEWPGIRRECWIVCPHCTLTGRKDHGTFPASNLDEMCPKGRVTCDRHDERIPACLVYPVDGHDYSRHQKGLEEYTNQLAEHGVSLPNSQAVVKEGTPPNEVLEELAAKIGDSWKTLGRRLQFHEAELTAFHKENEQYSEKAYKMLLRWKERNGADASYQVLHEALCHRLVSRRDLAAELC